jgi:hypothetical protein
VCRSFSKRLQARDRGILPYDGLPHAGHAGLRRAVTVRADR